MGNPDDLDPIESVSSRPDLQILVYPVIDFELSYGPCSALLADATLPSHELLHNLSTQYAVSNATPPAFLAHSFQDDLVPIQNSMRYEAALQNHSIPVSVVFAKWGPHGAGLHDKWTVPAQTW